jgi:RNA polymerase sigma factor (sigma-70 family)
MHQPAELIQNLFRQEFSKMVAVISKHFGLEHISIAEDVVSETFLQAIQSWQENGIPENPAAWLWVVAKRKTLYHFRRKKIFQEKVIPALKAPTVDHERMEINFSAQQVKDAQLQMMFAICDPAIASEAQIGLALRVLCGFTIEEIAEAFLTNKETIYKRLNRAREKLKKEKIVLEFPPENEANKRLDNVLHILYLLFNEGYYSTTKNQVLRQELCSEALRLAILLTEFKVTNQPKAAALIAMMCFHASRFNARQTDAGQFVLYENQNAALWNYELIAKGMQYLEQSAQGEEVSSFHLEAGIAFCHCEKEETEEKWNNILHYYDLLLQLNDSPVVMLNGVYAVYKVRGKKEAVTELEDLRVENNHFYFTLLGELYTGIDNVKAAQSFQKALALAKTETDKQTLEAKMLKLSS